jgi:phage terminase small subunit
MPESIKSPSPPKDLLPESAAWWRSVVETYELEPHHLRLLLLACRTWDQGEAARKALRKNGTVYVDRHGVRRSAPEFVIQKNCAITFARLLRELRLDSAPDEADRVPRNAIQQKRRAK